MHLNISIGAQLEEPIKDLVQVRHAPPARNLCNVVERLARVIADPRVVVAERGEHWCEE